MEKIQQAIDKARDSRNESGSEQVSTTGVESDVANIRYTNTQSVNSSVAVQRENRIISGGEQKVFAHSFKILSTQTIHRMEEHDWKSLAVTSVCEGEGSTTVAINLGISIAKEVEYTVLVVDANLRDPGVHKHFGIEPKFGLSHYLNGEVELSDILIKPENINHFVILPAGDSSLDSSELLGSPRMVALVEELKQRYPKRIIIFDLPAVLGTADTLSFIPSVDAALLVVEDDVTKESSLKMAVDYLSETNIIGTVLNKAQY